MGQVILKAKSICKSFANNGSQNHVLHMIDLSIYQEDFTVIMGPSGAGKSTLLYALSGMDSLTSGELFYKEQTITNAKEKVMAAIRAKEFGFVFQQTHLIQNLTLLENVMISGYLDKHMNQASLKKRSLDLLKQMHVASLQNRYPSQVSGGEAQRAAIARAMINHPTVLFADEPTGSLHKRSSEEVLALLSELHAQGQSIVMVTHDVKAAIHASRLLYIEDGRIVDEMLMPPYQQQETRKRESQINAWLTAMEW